MLKFQYKISREKSFKITLNSSQAWFILHFIIACHYLYLHQLLPPFIIFLSEKTSVFNDLWKFIILSTPNPNTTKQLTRNVDFFSFPPSNQPLQLTSNSSSDGKRKLPCWKIKGNTSLMDMW